MLLDHITSRHRNNSEYPLHHVKSKDRIVQDQIQKATIKTHGCKIERELIYRLSKEPVTGSIRVPAGITARMVAAVVVPVAVQRH